jgi:hypothetical protein
MKFRTYIMLCTLVFAIGGGLGFVWPTIAQTLQQEPQQTQDPNQDPTQDERTKHYVPGPKKLQPQNITLSYQPNMPVELTSIKEEFANGRDTIVVTLKNISAKAFRSYGVNVTAYKGSKQRAFSGYSVVNHPSHKGYLNPGLPIEELLSDSFLEADEVVVEVDFIEFDNGEIWGPNRNNGLDNVKGQRAGMLASLEKLISMVDQQGSNLLLTDQLLDIPIPSAKNHSSNWQQGFETGVSLAQSPIKRQSNAQDANKKLLELYSELKPIVEQDNEQQ